MFGKYKRNHIKRDNFYIILFGKKREKPVFYEIEMINIFFFN